MEIYHEWFGDKCLIHWFKWITNLCLKWISKSLNRDKMESLNEEIFIGSSWVDLQNILIDSILGMWRILEWPYSIANDLLIESLNECITFYTNKMSWKMIKENFNYSDKEYEISSKLFVAINNMIMTENTIDHLVEMIYDNLINRNVSVNKEYLFLRFQATIKSINTIAASIRKKIISKVKHEVDKNLSDFIAARTAQNKSKAYNEIFRHANYCVYTMIRSVHKKALETILEDMWNAILDILDSYTNDLLEVDKSCCFPKQIKGCSELILTEYQDALSRDGEGLSYATMKNEKYKRVKGKLELLEMMDVKKGEKKK